MIYLLRLLLLLGLLRAATASAQSSSGHTARSRVLLSAGGLAGHVPGYFRYAGAGLGVARVSQWRYPDAEYDSDFTVGLRLSLGRQRGVYAPVTTQRLWGLNPYAASDGRFFGLNLGVWLGQLGTFRDEGTRASRVLPQVRARAGQLTGWHGLIGYALEFGGLGNPLGQLGGAYGGLFGRRLALGAGAAIPTLAPVGSEVQLYTEARLRLGENGSAAALWQPAFSSAAPWQLKAHVSYGF